MTDWTLGYVADVGYTYGYYNELNPLRLKLAFVSAGLVAPEVATACELGFGQGLSVNLHAAAGGAHWHATDFNPAQAGFARELAEAGGHGARLHDQSFAEFCARDDLPTFDFIGLHGIWSWISDDNRATIVDFVRRKLAVGGVLYASYNTQPGWATMVPLRDLMIAHTEILGSAGQGTVSRIDAALAFAERLLGCGAAFGRANPQIAERLQRVKEQNRNYLAHEYFNRDWTPMSFDKMAAWLAPAKLDFACSAHYLDHAFADPINFTAEQQALLREVPDVALRQTTRDFVVNQQFRRDYWVRGPRPLDALEYAETLRAQRVVLIQPRADVAMKVTGHLGEATLQEAIYAPLLDALGDHKPRTLGQLETLLQPRGVEFSQLAQAILVLTGAGALTAAQDETLAARLRKQTERLNQHLLRKARASNELMFLASPATGGGIAVPRFQQLFLLARAQGHKQPAEWAAFAWRALAMQGQRIIKEGKALERDEDNLAELQVQATAFADKQLPMLKALQVA